jgi:predicted dienelactone hydrolase
MALNRRRFLALPMGAACLPAVGAEEAGFTDETWTDPARHRALPVRLRWPAGAGSATAGGWPVVLFSHGLGGTREGGEIWGQAWAAAGLVVVHLQHPGSDLAAVRAVARDFSDQAGLRRAAGPQQLLARLLDVGFVLDEIARRQQAGDGRWAQVRAGQVGMSGHSFGAHTTLGMAGQSYPGHPGITEPRLAAFVAFSPSPPVAGDPVRAFSRITRPTLCLTGSRDGDVVGNGSTPERRMSVFDALPGGRKAMLVLQDADHMSFGGQTGRAVEIIPRAPVTRTLQGGHHALIAALTTDWWRASLLGDPAAQARLAAPQGLGDGDRWRTG